MKICEGLMGIYKEEFGSHECIECNRPLNRVKKNVVNWFDHKKNVFNE